LQNDEFFDSVVQPWLMDLVRATNESIFLVIAAYGVQTWGKTPSYQPFVAWIQKVYLNYEWFRFSDYITPPGCDTTNQIIEACNGGIKSVNPTMQSFSNFCSSGEQITTNYLTNHYCKSKYIGRVNQMNYLLNVPTPTSLMSQANSILQRNENCFEVDSSTLSPNCRMFYFNCQTNLYQYMAGTNVAKGKYNVTKTRVDKFRKLIVGDGIHNSLQDQEQFQLKLSEPTKYKSFEELHYATSTLYQVTITYYDNLTDIPYRNEIYRESNSIMDPKFAITLACTCKVYRSNGFRCPEIYAALDILDLYSVGNSLSSLQPVRKIGRPKSRGTALSKYSPDAPHRKPENSINVPIRCQQYGNGVIRRFQQTTSGTYEWYSSHHEKLIYEII